MKENKEEAKKEKGEEKESGKEGRKAPFSTSRSERASEQEATYRLVKAARTPSLGNGGNYN